MTGTWGYLGDGTGVFIPERKFTYGSPFYSYRALRGNAFTMAVFDRHGKCVGWSDKSDPVPPEYTNA